MSLFSDQLARSLAEDARQRVTRFIKSRTLRNALTVVEDTDGTFRLFVPHFWAIYYHDGRGPIVAKPGHFLVYFKNPDQDPRLQGGHPERANQIRRLTKEQFRAAIRAGQVIATKRVRRAKGNPFFTRGLRSFVPAARKTIERRTIQQAKLELKDVLKLKGTIRVRL